MMAFIDLEISKNSFAISYLCLINEDFLLSQTLLEETTCIIEIGHLHLICIVNSINNPKKLR